MASIPIQPLPPAQGTAVTGPIEKAGKDGGAFGKLVKDFAKEVNQAQERASDHVAKLSSGNVDNVHQAMIELGKAEITFNYMMQVRNKLIDAYKEVMRMQM